MMDEVQVAMTYEEAEHYFRAREKELWRELEEYAHNKALPMPPLYEDYSNVDTSRPHWKLEKPREILGKLSALMTTFNNMKATHGWD